jgi:hypothetical protein
MWGTLYSVFWTVTNAPIDTNCVWFSCLYTRFITVPSVLYVTKSVMLKRSVRTAGVWRNCTVSIPSLFPAIAFLQNISVVFSAATRVMAANWTTNHLISPDPASVRSQLPRGKSHNSNCINNPPPPKKKNWVALVIKCSRRWHGAVVTCLNTVWYRMCSGGLKVTGNRCSLYWERASRQSPAEFVTGTLRECGYGC